MHRRLLAPLVVASMGACASPPNADVASPAPVPSGRAPASSVDVRLPQDTFVLVWVDAALHRTLDDKEPLQAYDFEGRPRSEHPGQAFVASLREARGPWRRVGAVSTWRRDGRPLHCLGNDIFVGRGLDVEVWVHERDLMPVLAQPFERRFDDGTFIALTPGTPVLAGRPWAEGFWFPVQVDGAHVGSEYKPTPGAKAPAGGGAYFTMASFSGLLDGRPVPWTQPVWSYAEEARGYIVAADTGVSHLLGWDCGSFELAVQGAPAEATGGVVGGMASTPPRKALAGAVVAGTPLVWPDGRPAGTVDEDLQLVELSPSSQPLTCMDVPVGLSLQTDRYLSQKASVCVETSKIRAVETENPSRL